MFFVLFFLFWFFLFWFFLFYLFLFVFCFLFFVFVLGFKGSSQVSINGLPVATADAFVTVMALAAAARRTIAEAIIWSKRAAVRFRELFEREHAFVQSTQLAANLCDNRLNERRNRISQALYHAQ